MDIKVWMYLGYLVISIGLTIWVARTLSRNGLIFLNDVVANEQLAKAINHLLVVGFYLLNLGYVTVAMRVTRAVTTTEEALETLSLRIGYVLLVLGVLHLFNVYALNRYRRSRLRANAPGPPLPPQQFVQPVYAGGGRAVPATVPAPPPPGRPEMPQRAWNPPDDPNPGGQP